MLRIVKPTYLALGLALITACKDKKPTNPIPAALVEVSPTAHTAPANTVINGISVKLTDEGGSPAAGETVTFTITSGDGSLTGSGTVITDANGIAAAPGWKMGKRANGSGGQILHVTSGSVTPLDITATVSTQFRVFVRFFGPEMNPGQKEAFTRAAERIQGIITGDVANVATFQQDLSSCAAGVSPITENIDDLLIYAQSKSIDGVGNVLGTARPCFVRTADATCAAGCVNIPVIGIMEFDSADLLDMQQDGTLQDVIQHEMLHVIGVGSMWNTFGLLTGAGGADPRFTGTQGTTGCKDVGGTVSCATTVPVENNGGAGTRDSHWRDATFGTELMTGYLDSGVNPLSLLTIKSLVDFGYVVNTEAADAYTIAAGSLRASGSLAPSAPRRRLETINSGPLFGISTDGRAVRRIK